MKLPEQMPARFLRSDRQMQIAAFADTSSADRDGVEPAACCAQVCLPFVGCHCILDLPICP